MAAAVPHLLLELSRTSRILHKVVVYNVAMKKTLWLAGIIVVASLFYGTMYLLTQQVLRTGANDPQIQIAEDMAAQLNKGVNATALNSSPKTDVVASLSPFLMIYDSNRQLVAATSILDGNTPVLPPGVLMSTSSSHENRLTWQPRGGVRLAVVVVKYNDGYVLAGRSLREVEKRETNLLDEIMIGWLVTVGFLLAWAWLAPVKPKHG